MNRVNPSNIVGVGGAQGSRERANDIDRLTQSGSALKASNGGIGKGHMQGVGPDGKVYVTTLVERASGRAGTMRYFANGKLLTNITNLNDARGGQIFAQMQHTRGSATALSRWSPPPSRWARRRYSSRATRRSGTR